MINSYVPQVPLGKEAWWFDYVYTFLFCLGLAVANVVVWSEVLISPNLASLVFWCVVAAVYSAFSLGTILTQVQKYFRLEEWWLWLAFPVRIDSRKERWFSMCLSVISIVASHFSIIGNLIHAHHLLTVVLYILAETVSLVLTIPLVFSIFIATIVSLSGE